MKIICYLPNVISCLRIVLIWPFLFALLSENYYLAFYLFVIAGLSDGVDGYLARKLGCVSFWGGLIDPLADKFLLMTSYIFLAVLGKLPYWLMGAVVIRDIVIMLGVIAIYFVYGRIEFDPSRISKYNTVLQVIFIFLLLFELAYYALPTSIVNVMQYIVLLTTVLSLSIYVWTWGAKAYRDGKLL